MVVGLPVVTFEQFGRGGIEVLKFEVVGAEGEAKPVHEGEALWGEEEQGLLAIKNINTVTND